MIYEEFRKERQVAVLIDPEKTNSEAALDELIRKTEFAGVHYLFVGGSTVSRDDIQHVVHYLKKKSKLPIILFPGASHQISEAADAILYLSLISGRNPDYLIGHHVQSASELYSMDIEVIPTGYILIDGGNRSSVAYVSQTTPIPVDKPSIILNTAKAGIMLGKKVLYLDAGSGAKQSVPEETIRNLALLGTPLIIGGGVRTANQIEKLHNAGANVVVIGNKVEEDLNFLLDVQHYLKHTT